MRLSIEQLATEPMCFLLRRFREEANLDGGNGQHEALWLRDDGSLMSHRPFSLPAAPDLMMWAHDMLTILNRELHHDGAWVVVFTNPLPSGECVLIDVKHADYARYALIWLDADADPQFTVEWARGESEMHDFADVMDAGRHSTAEKCEAAWLMWKDQRDVLDLQPHQLIRKAKGEAPATVRH